jgi:hypothetical protein
MGLFWDFLKFGLPTVGAVGLGVYTYKKGWKPVPIAGAAAAGWGAGYLLYYGASRAANHVEGLPSNVIVPQVGQFPGPDIGQATQGELPSSVDADSRNASPYWDVKPGAQYTNEARGKDGQPPDNSVVIDMTTRQPVQSGEQAPQMAPEAPKSYDPGDSFGSGGSQGGI